ncbi:hypothetical protein [Streptomyces ochraceiscleroticus]|uniref:Uncharacterized protein n=1 Tax=Streptomyces ochraceiscleroticus TaxID=47761 RepID=A0ABW1MKT3_9ACTN|nr:hypothetical protein [Streptomyces ochraceiscleroticus]
MDTTGTAAPDSANARETAAGSPSDNPLVPPRTAETAVVRKSWLVYGSVA